ncbi:hypothetical protein BZA05DRAFT_47459 [Tricharina praecox]|uniref:uncharacterized protein n=1 Tax=Tricharina praecox TaxID=43433 RepID=UPI00221E6C94|nr:uncharacterized protein BZA05DRAFT_47459 [Tricharina praecox]KAI5851939.1 hypothetical protein BZA05DRAFT_47459 [Tricharina praecox]
MHRPMCYVGQTRCDRLNVEMFSVTAFLFVLLVRFVFNTSVITQHHRYPQKFIDLFLFLFSIESRSTFARTCRGSLTTSYLPTSYLPTSYLPTSYLPTSYLPTSYLPTSYLGRTKIARYTRWRLERKQLAVLAVIHWQVVARIAVIPQAAEGGKICTSWFHPDSRRNIPRRGAREHHIAPTLPSIGSMLERTDPLIPTRRCRESCPFERLPSSHHLIGDIGRKR